SDFRDQESDAWVDQVIRTADAVPAMVGVVTGGEPLFRPERAERIISALALKKSVVLDTSGVGDLAPLLAPLQQHRVHVRVSLDSVDPRVNDAHRPASRQHLPLGTSAHAHAVGTIRRILDAGIACSVQTVVTSQNGDLGSLLRLRDFLANLGVNTWVLHILVP